MAEPKKQTTRSKGRQRRKAKKYSLPQTIDCSNCGQPTKAHQVCPHCGYLKKKKIEVK